MAITTSTEQMLSISTESLSGTLDDKVAAAAAASFTGIEIGESDLIASPWAPSRLRRECADRGLTADVYRSPWDFEPTTAHAFAAVLRRAGREFAQLEQFGLRTVLIRSSGSGMLDDADTAAEQLSRLASLADGHGLRLAYEAVPWGRFVRSAGHAWEIVRRTAHPALGLSVDSFHVLAGPDDATVVATVPGDQLLHVRLADARRGASTADDSRRHRLFPGLGVLDLPGFLSHVHATGYAGPLSLAVGNDIYRQMDPWQTAVDGMRALRMLVAGLPPTTELAGYAFVELGVDDDSGPAVGRLLAALGFARTGRHRSKPVDLWQQGDVRILLNAAPHQATTPGTAAICALGVAGTDPAGSARRADRLLAPLLPRTRQAGEADLNSVAAPDGTAVFFCHGDFWTADFAATGEPRRDGAWTTGIDHVALTETVDDFDQAALFYRCVLGLQPGELQELAAPFGMLHSRAFIDPSGRVRITLNAAIMRRGDWAPGVHRPQHIAFATTDAIAAAKQVRASVLPIPANYYDYLDAHWDLPPGLLAEMRAHSVLFDRDEHGDYLHFSTPMVGSRVFFEVVQRLGDYRGFGDPNSVPVRMAGHRERRIAALRQSRRDYSLAHLTALSLSPPDLVDAAAEAGYRYVGLRLTRVTAQEPNHPLTTDPALMRTTKVRLAATGIEVLDIELARIGPDDDPRTFQRVLEAGAELGARHVISQLPDPDPERKVDNFARLCEMARPLGLTIDLEFPSWTQTSDLHEAVRVLRAAGQPNAGILVDLLHFARSQSDVRELRRLPAEWFHFVHVCDALAAIPATDEGLIRTARFERLFPGDGGIDVHGILDALPSGIPYALEIPRADSVASVGPKEHARLSLAAARRYLDLEEH
ncbi:TIM barrel protein [Paractinoplanes maris]|uniref:TIM barrel protein n=1 Tax=Paractinoplanes maris TaxID=1734446 RepID=UPI0020205D12|nr:TIM barrel protein [Actinoplanes maris]